ncbi:DUF2064 domain-containing protein [Agromyces sp. NPDC058484]|uniref:TIGR04282 family arsenosugar biosynthesis glycosyltransferase n=1 Tax=Agromyces sp. NPDC058484 TaxID=3346524 RepID=UPI00366749FA
MTAVVVIAKECLPGRVKTRLSPPFSRSAAARLAAASLDDTLSTVASLRVSRRVLYFDGSQAPAAALASGFEVLPQIGGGLDERLAHLFDVLAEPTLLVGMDTPQLGAPDVAAALASLAHGGDDGVDCWFGPAADGGFWALGMREPRGDLVRGVPMSRGDTGALQRRRLEEAGLAVGMLAVLTDVDTAVEASVAAALAPGSRFAREFRRLTEGRPA